MLTVIIGFSTHSIKGTPTVLYCGPAGEAMQTAIDTNFATYPKIYRYNLHDRGIPVRNKAVPAPPPPPGGEEETQKAKQPTPPPPAPAPSMHSTTSHAKPKK